jgi:CBS domain containing-hemolysin-like protein
MTIVLAVLYGALLICLLIVLGVHPQLSSHSRFELQRRAHAGNEEASLLLKRHSLLRDIFSLQRVVSALILVTLSVIGVELFHWALGFFISLVIALESGAVARIGLWQQHSQKLYERYEPKILTLIEKHPFIFRAIRSVAPIPNDMYDIESKEELLEMVEQSGDALTSDQKQLIVNSLTFDQRRISEIMTPKSMIDSVQATEMLGPLVLDDLHKTGHSRFPVVKGDIDHVVGTLYIQNLLTIDHKSKTQRAETAMEKKVYYIREDQTLQHALAAFLRVRHHLFIVVNEFRETVGLLSLEDVIEALLGRKIIDEFDVDEDLRTAAEQNPRKNNTFAKAQDV